MTAKMKVKVGVRLFMAEARVGELYSIPLYRHKLFESPNSATRPILKKTDILKGGSSLLGKMIELLPGKDEGKRKKNKSAYNIRIADVDKEAQPFGSGCFV